MRPVIESKLTGAESVKSQQEPEDSTLPSIPKQLARGMGSFAKACGCSQPTRCQHLYFIRYRDAGGKQWKESGFLTQDAAKDRLVELYALKATTPASMAELMRHYGQTQRPHAEVIRSLPGVGVKLGAEFLAATGGDMDAFGGPDRLAGFAGWPPDPATPAVSAATCATTAVCSGPCTCRPW